MENFFFISYMKNYFSYFSYRIIELFVYAQTASFPLITTSRKILVTFFHVKLLFIKTFCFMKRGIKVFLFEVLYRLYNKYFFRFCFIFQSKISQKSVSICFLVTTWEFENSSSQMLLSLLSLNSSLDKNIIFTNYVICVVDTYFIPKEIKILLTYRSCGIFLIQKLIHTFHIYF